MSGLTLPHSQFLQFTQREQPLPALREDLRLLSAAANHDGSPAWMIHDPVSNRFFRIGWVEFELLSRWNLASRGAIVKDVVASTPLAVDEGNLRALERFLIAHQLVRVSNADEAQGLATIAQRARANRWLWLIHNYLFLRLPLLRPQQFLSRTLPWIEFVFTPAFAASVGILTLFGIILTARQWDIFVTTLIDSWSWQGLLGYAGALAIAKSLHELGHAYTATRYGVRVAHMGVALVVLWPMLYTDTTESWRLGDRRRRFNIAAAGVTTELGLAGIATLCWSLAPDGVFKGACFFLAAVSWVMTLAINASPFMRFDGYFLLSDALDMPNLHARAFALTRAWLRRTLLGWNEPNPETFEPSMRRFLIAFSIATWVYRLLVFLAIAAVVYFFFFKVAGIILFAIEIAWFIVRPIALEANVWVRRRKETPRAYRFAWMFAIGLLLIALMVPWTTSVSAPAWLRAAEHHAVFTPVPARIATLRNEGALNAGDVIAVLDAPDTRSRAVQAALAVAALSARLDQAVGRSDGMQLQRGYAEALAQQVAVLESERAELRRLELRAPFSGRLLDVERTLAVGSWIGVDQALGVVVGNGPWIVEAFVDQRGVQRIRDGAGVWFYPVADARTRVKGKIVAIDSTRLAALPHAMLAAPNGGQIAVLDGGGGLQPRETLYRVRIAVPERPLGNDVVSLGRVNIEGEARSIAADWFRNVAAVLIRESGF